DGRAANANLFGAREFALMPRRALFLNLCRGHIVDIEALHGALASGHLAGAAIDVFPTEPKKRDANFITQLQGMSNVILTPHVGGSTQEAQVDIGRYVAGKLSDYEALGSTSMSVNLPDIAAGPFQSRRILHLHRNVPGVMAGLNSIFAASDLNIGAQQLSTRGQIGYSVTDVQGSPQEGLLDELRRLDGTLRVRVLP
ncbi:MAG: phosphoglycerate dehydrogenase, partial [Propionibacterium sp.]|nr:phosphoglycerate dehydrogenase [Propionibacterium sp.]